MNDTENKSPESAPESSPKKITRPQEGRMIAGVCAGLARHFEIDATLVRIGMLLVTCGTGIGLFVYPICWVVIPEE